METKDILRKRIGTHIGYQVQHIAVSLLSYKDIVDLGYKLLQRVPHKVSSFCRREKINKVYKSDCMRDPLDNYYLVVSTDGTIFILEY